MARKSSIVLFVCEHGSAKSAIAAARVNKLARERNLNAHAMSRGPDPEETYTPNVMQVRAVTGYALKIATAACVVLDQLAASSESRLKP